MDSQRTDEQCLAAFVGGDRAALGELARRHEASLLGVASGLLGGCPSLASDAVQETWVRVIRYGHSFNGRSSLRTWLYRITVNCCRDIRSRTMPEQRPDPKAQSAAGCPDPGQVPLIEERDDALYEAVGRLSDSGRELVLLCYHDGLTHKQAAEVLEIPLGTLKSRLHAVLEQLREHLCIEAKL